MRSLFFKIFLWLWVAMVLINLSLFAVAVATQPDQSFPRPHGVLDDATDRYARNAAHIYEQGGRQALQAYLQQVERRTQLHAYLLDEAGNDYSGQSALPGSRSLARTARRTDDPVFQMTGTGRSLTVARRVLSHGGAYFVFVGVQQRELRNFFNVPPGVRLARVFAVILTGFMVCLWLARYLTSPVLQLRSATQRLADGDLKARVGNAMGRRRDELADLGRDFDRMADRMEGLLTAQHRLLGDISHELRSPLARLNVALAIARRHSGEGATGALDRIERETGRLNELIGQLLALSRMENGDAPPALAEIDLGKLVEEVAIDADFEARASGRGVTVEAAENCFISGSPELLRSAIENVVRNAVRYTAEGTEVKIALKRDSTNAINPHAVVTVCDHGPGVPDASLAQLFQPFYRVEEARDRQSGGTGLGLTIAQRAMRSHGGSVEAANREGGGLCVKMFLPLLGDGE